ncbi:AfsR/SARP family transcriptional regulator [Streptomyces sp. CBMA29]|uniref:AfsR/SARP family transcriptional regulator n=1 Tax=Streptomyces sp. CBMA29 TaxID=1896314 RepID=UPI001661E204|nr:AfsR/SARP family transcriptional regulator [Streptomyces sp. CBMA29]MBD0735246.1 SARP family transcriptional regulator [Streptomyces sp. CBMA29]
MRVAFGVLGPVVAWAESGDGPDEAVRGAALALRGPRHRAVLARLVIARRRVVPVARLVEDLWPERPGDDGAGPGRSPAPPADPVGTLRTFVAALRRTLEPDRPPRAPALLLVTEGPGYALRAAPDTVDAWRFEQAVTEAAGLPPKDVLALLQRALGWWRGPAYAEFADQPWARAERSRLAELRLHAVERRAEARLSLGLAAEAAADLDAHAAEHPWREDAWRLLALALYRSGRQGDALAVLRRARTLLVEQLGVDPGPGLRALEADILRQADDRLDPGAGGAERVWAEATAAYDRTVPTGARARLESTVTLLRGLAVTGGDGLQSARRHRLAAVSAAEELGDPHLCARVIGAYDVPAVWTRLDDPAQAAHVVAAAERTLTALPPGPAEEALRARLLATIALESRGGAGGGVGGGALGGSGGRGAQAARLAEEAARRLDDPVLLAFALNAAFMQTFQRAGLAPERDAIGAELVELSARHGLFTSEVLGRLIRLQAACARGDFGAADEHAAAADRLAERHELPLVEVFTRWYGALRLAETGTFEAAEAAYGEAAAELTGAGMPGLERGLLPLALLSLRLRHGRGLRVLARTDVDWGPYAPWVRPLLLLAEDRRSEAAAALRGAPEPPRDLLYEAMWTLTARAALALGSTEAARRAYAELLPAADELAGAASGLLSLGPVNDHLRDLTAALRTP